jgi:hypothetical protein
LKLFELIRTKDVTGISGTGTVAEGIQFSSGTCVIQWTTDINSIGIYASIEHVIHIHGHEGSTIVYWQDEDAWL